ncbi:dicarboxylate/amino acid:cation symporter [Anaerococcus tetradius]|uniref:Transporter, dicarboxylate/amino acid:cation Na+/H+ symporter family protein n=1 Tax=Anaerococcus tetradius ATCC 35098 TaxID=525255 RepID=C2CF95_9FIRM|nr:dicarboxylate/amino acid:cation symporter [Anaerococcus tetradius]EEI83714.1 transporter, dicarboxylate/amino acid:cation Na+/H+ symporter family protein [Anaerococcus tetradius ATCC 35098]
MKKIGLLPRLIIAIVLGIILGLFGPAVIVRILITFNGLFGNFLNFVIPLIIMGFVIPGIADLGSEAGKTLAITAGIAYLSTITFGTATYFTGSFVLPNFIKQGAINFNPEQNTGKVLEPFFTSPMDPIFSVTTALIMSFILGVGIAAVKGDVLKKAVHEFSDIITKLISNIVIPLLPIHIAGIFANMAYQGTVAEVLKVFSKVFLMVIILHWLTILIQYSIASSAGGGSPFKKIKTIFPAYMTAIGTQSSAATIPVTLRQTYKMGVNKGIADFVIPLCATIHLSGSTITLTSCSMAILMLQGADVTLHHMFPFILMLGVTMVAAPGVPGGAVMAALGILQSMLGFTEPMTALIIALYVAQDSFGTACNISGDAAIACIVNKINGFKLDPAANEEYIKDLA